MRLLDIEISGFKSFANSIRIPIDRDIIGFVGPNGCGKSNIVDAIKWVIGEQNPREIRCERGGDVIFNGSTLHAAHGMAEVTLRLSNEDKKIPLNYNEIEITRRLYKNGDSEYHLNRTPVRLKDINRLLSGTGLGESSYTLFKASVIDDLLRPNSMLINSILSEASGIAKYKLDKKETLRKLILTRDAMKRGEDIIAEVSSRLKTLKYQSEKARRYNKLKEEIENKEKLYLISAYKSLKIELSEIEDEISNSKNQEIEQINRFNEIEKTRKDDDERIIQISEIRESLSQNINSINEELNGIIGERSTVLAEMKSLQDASQSLLKEKKNLTEELPKIENNIISIRKEIAIIEGEIEALNSNIRTIDKKIEDITKNIANKNAELNIKKRELEEKRNDLRTRENALELEKRTYQFNIDRISDLKDDLDSKIEESRKIREELPDIENELAEKLTEEEKLKETVRKLKDQLIATNTKINNKKEELGKIESRLGAMKSESKILNEMEKNNEGIGEEAIKFKNSGKSLLMDKIEVKNNYEQLIESLLTNYRDTVLLNDKNELLELVKKIIGKKNIGKINFIYKNSDKTEEYASTGNIKDFIKKGSEYLPSFIMNTKVVNSPENIDYNSKVPQITQDGRIFYYQNFLSIGGDGNIIFIGRRKQIENLGKAIEIERKKSITLKDEIEKLMSAQEKLLNSINHKEENAARLSKSITIIEEKIRILKGKMDLIDTEVEDIREEISEFTVNVDDIKSKLNELKNAIAIEREELPVTDRYEEELKKQRNSLENFNRQMQDMLIEKVRKENDFENKMKLLKDAEIKVISVKERIKNIESDLKSSVEKVEKKKRLVIELEEKEKELHNNIDKFRDEDKKYKYEIINLRKNIENQQNKMITVNKELETIRKSIEEIKLKRASVIVKLDDLVIKLRNSYGVDADKSDFESEEKIPTTEEIEKIKDKLHRMEPINLLALKEYDEVKERHDFLTKQRDDLIEAEKSLLKTIEISDKRAKEDFEKNFNVVRDNFNKLFIELFGGGKSNIVIENTTDPIESKIIIYAQPPGKKVKNITMLSTGEQTLAAIALLFAIYQTKPSPFCFMDEIDAPLDDANVERFITLLKRLKRNSQILMITHNRRTMEICEYIYGITMEEGISKVVSINIQKEVEEWG